MKLLEWSFVMIMMLKLTTWGIETAPDGGIYIQGGKKVEVPITVNADSIETIEYGDHRSILTLKSGRRLEVKENVQAVGEAGVIRVDRKTDPVESK